MKILISLAALSLLIPSVGFAACQDNKAVFLSESDGVRHIIYGSDGLDYGSDVSLEEWRNGKLAWRAKGTVTCSNGASICYLVMENASGLSGNDATTDAVIETIDDDGDGVSDYVVLAALGQSLYYTNGLKVQWFNGFGPEPDERITVPNIYKFLSCRR